MFQSAICRKEFQTVAVIRKMARGNHDRTIHFRFIKDNRHEHRRRRCKPAIHGRYALAHQSLEHCLLQAVCRNPRIMPHSNPQVLRLFPRLPRKEINKTSCNTVRCFRIKIDRLISYPFYSHSAYITAILQFHDIFLRNHCESP